MSAIAERTEDISETRADAAAPTPAYAPLDLDALAANPVARAHARARSRQSTSESTGFHLAGVWLVVIPAIFFLASNPVGWLLLFLLCLGGAVLTGFGGIL